MAVVGHWSSLAEAQKLVQSMLLAGIIGQVIDTGSLLRRMPVKQVTGIDLAYNREDQFAAEDAAAFFDIREQIPWTSDVTVTKINTELKRIIRQDPIDKFVRGTYNDPNDYQSIMIAELVKRVTRFTEHQLIYGDVDFGSAKQFDGLHALAEETDDADNELDIDEGEGALSLFNLRILLDAMFVEQDDPPDGAADRSNVILLMPKVIARRIDSGYQEAGLVRSSVTHVASEIQFGRNEQGARITFFDGIPIVRSSFMRAEQANTGQGADARALRTSGTNMFSILAIRFGQIEDGGLSYLFGGDTGPMEFMRHETFDKLENYDSGGERIVSYGAPALGAIQSVGRIFDITDAEVTP